MVQVVLVKRGAVLWLEAKGEGQPCSAASSGTGSLLEGRALEVRTKVGILLQQKRVLYSGSRSRRSAVVESKTEAQARGQQTRSERRGGGRSKHRRNCRPAVGSCRSCELCFQVIWRDVNRRKASSALPSRPKQPRRWALDGILHVDTEELKL